MKRKIALALSALVLAASLAGCSKGSSGQAAGNSSSGSNAPATIVWAGWSGEEAASKPIFQRMIQEYHTETGNTAQWVGFTWNDAAQQLLIRAKGGEQLDISQADISIFNTLAKSDVLADLTDIVGKDYLEKNFDASTLAVGNVGGKQLGLPWTMASINMVYNPKILAAAGWKVPPKTMDEFDKCLADVKALGKGIIPYALSTKDTTCGADLMPWLWTFGGSVFDKDGKVSLNSEAGVKTLDWYQSMLKKGYIAMDVGRSEARTMFAQGKVAFYDDAVVAKSQVISNGVAPDKVVDVCSAMPRPVLKAGDQPQSVQWGGMLVIYKNSKYKEQAAQLAKMLVGDKIALDYFKNGGMPPVTKSAKANPDVQKDPFIKTFLSNTQTARLEETARMTNADAIKKIMTEEIQSALLGQKSSKQALDETAQRITSAS
jgi:multiple sugar transport system substrate-binding protein